MPTGEPTAIACDDARTVVQQARTSLAGPGRPGRRRKVCRGGQRLARPARPLVGRARRADRRRSCAATTSGSSPSSRRRRARGPAPRRARSAPSSSRWVDELRAVFDEGERDGPARRAGASTSREAWKLASVDALRGRRGHAQRPRSGARPRPRGGHAPRRLRRGDRPLRRGGAGARGAGARRPTRGPRVVTAAALRAYVPQLDAHGAWAPLDEELSIYDLALEADPPRAPLDRRMPHGARRPDRPRRAAAARGRRRGAPRRTDVAARGDERGAGRAALGALRRAARHAHPRHRAARRTGRAARSLRRVRRPSADGDPRPRRAARISASRWSATARAARRSSPSPTSPTTSAPASPTRSTAPARARDLRGVVLDLRANGGGSTDGAIAAIGLFLPGAALFPMRRRDGGMEVERAPDVPADKRYGRARSRCSSTATRRAPPR